MEGGGRGPSPCALATFHRQDLEQADGLRGGAMPALAAVRGAEATLEPGDVLQQVESGADPP